MKVQEVMERAGMNETGRAVAYIKDALEEINVISETHVTTQRIDLTKDQRFYELPNDQKKDFGSEINNLKILIQNKIDEYKDSFEVEIESSEIDLTRNIPMNNLGSRHPISLVRKEIVGIFE